MVKLKSSQLILLSSAFLAYGCGSSRQVVKASQPNDTQLAIEHELLGDPAVANEPEPFETVDLDIESEELVLHNDSEELETFIGNWLGTPHKMGGTSKSGVDCSGFVIEAYRKVYELEFRGRRAQDLYGEVTKVKRDKLEEGDLVFFKINGRRIDHVGIYLKNDEFVHVSSSRGVMVSNLNETYFNKRFYMGGRYE